MTLWLGIYDLYHEKYGWSSDGQRVLHLSYIVTFFYFSFLLPSILFFFFQDGPSDSKAGQNLIRAARTMWMTNIFVLMMCASILRR